LNAYETIIMPRVASHMWDGYVYAEKLVGWSRRKVSWLFKKKRDVILLHPTPPQALLVRK
jgi:hypothetical protein